MKPTFMISATAVVLLLVGCAPYYYKDGYGYYDGAYATSYYDGAYATPYDGAYANYDGAYGQPYSYEGAYGEPYGYEGYGQSAPSSRFSYSSLAERDRVA